MASTGMQIYAEELVMHRTAAAILLLLAGTLTAHAQTASKPPTPAEEKPASPALATQPLAKPCGIGVMSAVGDRFTLRKIGVTVFGNEDNKVSLGTWGIDDFIYAKIAAALGSRRSVRRLAYSKAALSAYENADVNIFRNYDGELRNILREAAAKTGCQRLIAVMKTSTRFSSTNQGISGLGILATGGDLLVPKTLNLYVVISMTVYDGRTFDRVKYKLVSEERGINLFSMKAIRGLSREVDSSWWPDPARVGSDARLRDATRDLISRGLNVAVPDLIADAQL
jgi:hypothetical protein